jgi:hypothetical protein
MKPLIVSAVLLWISANAAAFEAYYTRLDQSLGGYVGKYSDLVVVLGQTNRLEFARANGYLPQWRTAGGIHSVENLFPDRDADPNCYYNYVRLLENGPDRIIVHWRHFKDIETIIKANGNLDVLNPQGITGVIHELFTIYPDGKVEREVREAAHTRYQDWVDPRLATRQSLKLTSNGIEHGPVKPGQKPPFLPRPAVKGNLVKESKGLPAPVHHWNFDDGMKPHDDRVKESVTGADCEITGLMTQFKKGVSGTALALDGYYTGVSMESNSASHDAVTVEAWVALDAYPYNTAPLVHHSKGFGREGWYLGLDAYGHPLVKVAGHTVKAGNAVLPLHQWTQVCATIGNRKIRLYIDGRELASDDFNAALKTPPTPLLLGRNNEQARCTDPVRGAQRNLEFLYGIQGLLDEVSVYSQALSADQVQQAYDALRPADRSSDLAKGVLPGEIGAARKFGATYKTLTFSDVWDQLWRDIPGAEIVVKFDKNPCSVIYWRGTNYAANWVADNNRWMADQSSETGGPHGCSEHMADKQVRHCHARIIENTPARVMIHWRYPCVDVSYQNLNPEAWSDEYHTIYPDGTGVRQVVWNGSGRSDPGFQDIQFLTNPGESALDVMNLQAMTLANLKGETRELTWEPPHGVPANTLPDATIEVLNSKSEHKVFAMFQGGHINPWGGDEQSKYTADPFAGPWNHWPMHLVPSDGRFAVAADRVTHFALGANDAAPKFGSMVLYGFTKEPITRLLPLARSWIRPPEITALSGCMAMNYRKETRDYPLVAEKETMSVRINASEENPIANLCFTVRNWGHHGAASVETKGAGAKDVRQGTIVDTDGIKTMIIWVELDATSPVNVTISGAKPSADHVAQPDPLPETTKKRPP